MDIKALKVTTNSVGNTQKSELEKIVLCIDRIHTWNEIHLFQQVIGKLQSIVETIHTEHWVQSIAHCIEMIEQKFSSEHQVLAKMTLRNVSEQLFGHEIVQIRSIENLSLHAFGENTAVLKHTIETIRNQIEMQEKVEHSLLMILYAQCSNVLEEDTESFIAFNQIQKAKSRYVARFITVLDFVDLIEKSIQQASLNEPWTLVITDLIQDVLEELKTVGIEEIQVLGEVLNGEYMISIGNIPGAAMPQFNKYEVCYVQERGFRDVMNAKVYREAKVLNVY